MSRYRDNPDAIRSLVECDRVHRDVYLSEELFELERERLFAHGWNYVGHDSQVPRPGDYYTTEIAGRPVIMVRHSDGAVRVLMNRCAHKGAKVVSETCGNTGKFFRCPYHAWTYRTDGSPIAVPLKQGYDNTRLKECESGRGLSAPTVEIYRGFVFVRFAGHGPEFKEYFGDILTVLDNLVERSPAGELQIAGGCLRSVMKCNWKMYLENINDSVHPVAAHESVSATAKSIYDAQAGDTPKSAALEQLLPFGSSYDFFEKSGGRVYPNGHSVLGTNASIHSHETGLRSYEEAMERSYGKERAHQILKFAPQNAIFFPALAVKSSPQTLRVVRPLSVDRTLVEIWSFAPLGAPQELLQRTVRYNRLTFSPMSVVGHDDVHIFQGMQQALSADGNEWVSLHREFGADEFTNVIRDVSGTNEILMRNQFRAWARWMTDDGAGSREMLVECSV